ncbi:histidine ammonia-lyase [Mucilaginibacter limnophilus]|uniref:Histidine ammonia-lyase n=1 Tax=Mucilaginibacter limnophilus TaxID=1932778 RepID=A0A437MZH6_9SPHI|nr:histidine ammonia-lyase [Mucilaginibacter limnophilus]RVU03058.1 histidine ammonia-lyase [Mucilaginibacter limnophilus]
MKPSFLYGSDLLTAAKAISLSRGELQGVIDPETLERVNKSSAIVGQIVASDKVVYGINTGFGPLCTTRISAEDTTKLQENLLKSHAVGVGQPIEKSLAKLMLVLKVHALAKGYSGITENTLLRILWHIDNNIIPVVPSQGSVGASGDLAPLSHLFLPLIGLGKVYHKNRVEETGAVLQQLNIRPITLSAKEGLALINGTQFIAAHAVYAVQQMQNLLDNADITGALMIEGLLGSVKPFHPDLHKLRAYSGSMHVANTIYTLLSDSEINTSHADCTRVQDPYSLRCIPQVHGAARSTWMHLKEQVEIEINSVTDNPVIINNELTISGGNFHGEPLALPLDYACLAVSELGNISDRRVYLSLEGTVPNVPKLLMKETGLNSGFMIVQYTSAALASENKGLCFPASADSIPTSLGQEDHVSMGSISGRKLLQVIANTEKILGIELLCAAQAVDFHAPLKSGKALQAIHNHVRRLIPYIEHDQVLLDILEKAISIIRSGELPRLVKQYTGFYNQTFDGF